METGKKIFYLSPDTGKESGNISTPAHAWALSRVLFCHVFMFPIMSLSSTLVQQFLRCDAQSRAL